MTALVIPSKHTCPYSKVYIGKEIKVVNTLKTVTNIKKCYFIKAN